MNAQIALIFLLSAIAISAGSLEAYKCTEYPIFTGDPSAPLRTVRVCQTGSNYFQSASQIEDQVRRSLSSNTFYSGNSVWPRPVFQESSKSWPLPSQSYNNHGEQLLPFQRQSIPLSAYASETFNQIGMTSNNPSTNNNELNTRNQMEVHGSLQQQLDDLSKDVSEVKDSIINLVSYIEHTLDTLHMQRSQGKSEENVNVNLKLDPSFEALLKQFFQLTKASTEKKEVQSEETGDNQEDVGSFYSTQVTTEDSSEENTTEVQDNTVESSTEQDAREISEEDRSIEGANSLEDLDNWLRVKFGPSIDARISEEEIDDILKKTSEEENSAEKSDESFETWFNILYRRYSTQATNDYNSVESTQSPRESNENVQKESEENSKEDSRENKYEDEISKSLEASKESSEKTDNSDTNVDYETFFVPTTMGTVQEDTTAEYLENGDRYGYAMGSKTNVKPASPEVLDCFRIALSTEGKLVKNFDECRRAFEDRNKSEESNEIKAKVLSDSNESNESGETESVVTDSDESKESRETESAVTDSNESKESEETEYIEPEEYVWRRPQENDYIEKEEKEWYSRL